MQTYHFAYDRASVRSLDADGHLRVASSTITAAAVNPYFGHEIIGAEALGLDRTKIYNLFRPPGELAKAAHTFDGKPLLSVHRPQMAENFLNRIVVGTVQNPVWENPVMLATLVVWDGGAIDGIEDGTQRSLSARYSYVAVKEPGTFEGKQYDLRMTNIVGNHVALVSEGRVRGAMVGDAKPKFPQTQRNIIVMDSTEPGYNPDTNGPDITGVKNFLRGKISDAEFEKLCELLNAPEPNQAMDSRRRAAHPQRQSFDERFPAAGRLVRF